MVEAECMECGNTFLLSGVELIRLYRGEKVNCPICGSKVKLIEEVVV
ncbi:MAG: hypothetical protein J7L31_05425 [Thermoplasmata archaeon]|nr:hypothetical protein [Thermoplasmata archaeon]